MADVTFRVQLVGPPLSRGGPPTSVALFARKDKPGHHRRGVDRLIGYVDFVPGPDGSLDAELELTTKARGPGDGAGLSWRPTYYMGLVSNFLTMRMGEPATSNEVVAGVPGKAKWVRHALAALVEGGWVAVESGPRNAQLHRLERPYDGDADD